MWIKHGSNSTKLINTYCFSINSWFMWHILFHLFYVTSYFFIIFAFNAGSNNNLSFISLLFFLSSFFITFHFFFYNFNKNQINFAQFNIMLREEKELRRNGRITSFSSISQCEIEFFSALSRIFFCCFKFRVSLIKSHVSCFRWLDFLEENSQTRAAARGWRRSLS